MTTTEDKPVDREAWRQLLDGGDQDPPELTDARIRAKARQALTPTTGRWWLPASLAASLLLAVVLVQWQFEPPAGPAIVSESDYLTPPAQTPAPQRQDESLAHAAPEQQVESAPASARQEGNQANETTMTQQRAAGAEAARDGSFVAPPPVVPPPLLELPATSDARALGGVIASGPAADAAPAPAASAPAAPPAEAKQEKDLGEIVVTDSRRRTADTESTTAVTQVTQVTQVTAADVTTQGVTRVGGLLKSGAAERTPEEWYAEIEKLRAAGKKRSAKRELEKLKAAHPGWLEENHPTDR